MLDAYSKSLPSDPVEAAAAQWFARRDRGLRESEQVEYEAWLRANPGHAAALARLEKAWTGLNPVFDSLAARAGEPDPDLLAPPPRRFFRIWIPLAAAAAAVALLSLPRATDVSPAVRHGAVVHPGPERLILDDGSRVDLNTMAKVEVNFTPTERRIRLVRGEAYFTVAKNPSRPFIVTADRVAVRAVGTAFSVGLGTTEVSVLVTDGRVGVEDTTPLSGNLSPGVREPASLVAGQQGVINLAAVSPEAGRPALSVTELTPAQIEHALLWQGMRLEFADMPLGDVIIDFNRYNRRKLVVRDAETAAIRLGGNFRADNVDGFVRLLALGFGVSASPHGDEIILRRTHAR